MTAADNVRALPATAASRLAEIQAERDRLAAEREQREAARHDSDELEAAERALQDDKAVASAECEHGPVGKKIAVIQTDLGVVIVKRPNHVLYKRFLDAADASSAEVEKLVRPSVVYPDKATFDRFCEEQPGILVRCLGQVAHLAGAKLKEVGGK